MGNTVDAAEGLSYAKLFFFGLYDERVKGEKEDLRILVCKKNYVVLCHDP
jgi:hypothetical protein